jgi:hypothetical protein
MSTTLGGTQITFNDGSTQSVSATNASNISSGTLPRARLPSGTVVQVSSFSNTTRAVPGGSPSNATYNILWSFTVTKVLTSSNLALQGSLPFDGTNAGRGVLFARINSGTYYTISNNNYCGLGQNWSLTGLIPATSLGPGNYTVDIAWTCSSGSKPFVVWNPNSTDQSNELFYPTQSNINLFELVV